MHDAYITLKSGEKITASIWSFKPREGYLTLVGDPDTKIYFKDIDQALQPHTRTQLGVIETVDLLVRAKDEGWGS